MHIELKNVKHSEFASHETNCYEASIYIDGKKMGYAENSGQGGTTSIYPNTLFQTLQAYAETLPPTEYDNGKHVFNQSADSVIDDLLTQWLYARDIKKAMQKRIVFIRGQSLLETIKMDALTLQKWLQNPDLLTKLKADKVLNLLSFSEAVDIYRTMA
jgi:hypothetical protein